MTGQLPEDGVVKALAALRRFRVLCDTMRIRDVRSIATAAVRDAANGADFLDRAERVIGCKIELLSGQREARLSALGVVSSIYKADGVVGDLSGAGRSSSLTFRTARLDWGDPAAGGPIVDGSLGSFAKESREDCS